MKTITLIASVVLFGTSFAQSTSGDIIGTLMNKEQTEGLTNAVAVTSRGEAVFRAMTDLDGRFKISGVPAGEYDVFFLYDGDTIFAPSKVEVAPDGIGDLGIVTQMSSTDIGLVVIDAERLRLGKGVAPEIKLSRKDITHRPDKNNVKSMITTMTSDVRQTEDGGLVFRGARKGDLINYIDGVKMTEVQNMPSSSIGYIMVYSGAIPAKYGDTTGGVVVMETVSYFDLLREWEARNGQ
jgi:hypothetical protein